MESDLLCFIPEYLCSGFAEHIFKGVGCCAIILFEGVGVDVHGRLNVGVSHDLLNDLDISFILTEPCTEGVAEVMS